MVRLSGVSESEIIFLYKYFPILVGYYKIVFAVTGKDAGWLVNMADWMVKRMPFKSFFGALYHTRADIKRKYPILSKYILKIKRMAFVPEAHK